MRLRLNLIFGFSGEPTERASIRVWKEFSKQQVKLHVTVPTLDPCSSLCSVIPHHVCVDFHQDQALHCTLAYIVPRTCQTSEKKIDRMSHMVLINTGVSCSQHSLLIPNL